MGRSQSFAWLIKNRVWGLTGGVGTGKSLTCSLLGSLGFEIVDADAIARKVRTTHPLARQRIKKIFGTLDRKKIRHQIFENRMLKTKLEKILFPLIRQESMKILRGIFKKNPQAHVIYEASQLIESGRYKDFQGPIVVTAPSHLRSLRITKRDAIPPTFAKKMIANQMQDSVRKSYGKWVIQNHSTSSALQKKVSRLAKKLLGK